MMADVLADHSTPKARINRSLTARLFGNPVAIKELRSRMRGRRAFAVLTLYLIGLSAVATLVYLAYVSSSAAPGGTAAYTAGKGLFAAVLGVQVFLVSFIGPAFTAGAISGERERQTFDLLRTTLLSSEALVMGKLISALSYIFLLVFVSIPLQGIAFLLGGLSPVELLLSQLLVLVAAVAYALFGLWCSATLPSTLTATVATFAGTLFMSFGIPLAALSVFILLGIPAGAGAASNPLVDVMLLYGGLILASVNLPATLIVSEAFLLQQDTLFFFSQITGGIRVWVFSPWLLFLLVHILAIIALFFATVRRVRRVSDV